jgi:hypothetical protein
VKKLPEVRAKVLGDVNSLKDLLKSSNEKDTYHFEVTNQDRSFVLSVSMSEPIAVLNQQTSEALCSISGIESVEFRAHAVASTWDINGERRKTTKNDVYFTVEINIYGNQSIQNALGRGLSLAKQYLQHPTFIEGGIGYANPHFVSILGVQPKPVVFSKVNAEVSDNTPKAARYEFEQSNFKNELAVVFTSLTRARCLKILNADLRIKTSLLR